MLAYIKYAIHDHYQKINVISNEPWYALYDRHVDFKVEDGACIVYTSPLPTLTRKSSVQ